GDRQRHSARIGRVVAARPRHHECPRGASRARGGTLGRWPQLQARLLVRDAEADLALLSLDAADLPTATVADAARVRIGSLVVAVGHPLGMRGALSAGIVHAIAPVVRGGAPWIHADVRLAPGNSGGPLADVSGAIVGVNAMIVGGLALAVPIARVIDFARSAGVAVP